MRVIGRHGVALMRTLEQKISDAGPGGQRVDPHILTEARQELEKEGEIVRLSRHGTTWYHITGTPEHVLEQRHAAQEPIRAALHEQKFGMRVGQALEIAVYRALVELGTHHWHFFGGFDDLHRHDDAELYRKQEPPSAISGKGPSGEARVDFILVNPRVGPVAIEVKNVREWLYPDRDEIIDLLYKCTALDAVPVLIARRMPFVTFKVLSQCGVLFHQTYNQRLPQTASTLADKAKHKDLLGYHDIRVGNDPDPRLRNFLHNNLPSVLPAARAKFQEYEDLLTAYGSRNMGYTEFAARVRRRAAGTNEDHDWDDDGSPEYDDWPDY